MAEITAKLDASWVRLAIVASRFNELVVKRLVDGAMEAFSRRGGDPARLTLVWAPGAFEAPLAVARLAQSGRYDAIVTLGAVIRGETPHFDFVAGEAARGAMDLMLRHGVPVGFGVLTCDTLDQAMDRAGGRHGNKGAEAADAAIEMANLLRHLKTDGR
ncbi:MAG: 6,7-dimethyl-8-ribityllumazine synthase [Phycisphaerales bacterium]|nr:6,7-dimethyl-8-ribityllumazine synthase [Phycisphaerales bacterium]